MESMLQLNLIREMNSSRVAANGKTLRLQVESLERGEEFSRLQFPSTFPLRETEMELEIRGPEREL